MEAEIKLCECGCGLPAPIAKRTRTKLGHIKGQPIRMIRGHAMGKYEIDREIAHRKEINDRKRYKERAIARGRALVQEYFEAHPCIDCGESDPVVLDFDHRNPEEKTMGIADLIGINQASNETLLREIEKCDVRCANCHRRKHYQERC